MTWVAGLPEGDTDWDRFAALCPEPFLALAGVVAATEEETDPVLLELARIRIATVLQYPAEIARRTARARTRDSPRPSWPTCPCGPRQLSSPR